MSFRVLSVASEVFPLAKTGGLADVAGALPAALALHDIEVHTLMPGYPQVMAALAETETLHTDPALFGGYARLLKAQHRDLLLLILDAPHLYDRHGLYGDAYGEWRDNPVRFAALARMGAQLAQGLLPGLRFDVVHGHDWQAGLLPAYLHYDGIPAAPSVVTIHNLAFQGRAPAALLPALGLPPESWTVDGVESFGDIGFLKAGLLFADKITTVSPTYATEICTQDGGMGLDGLLRSRRDCLTGILNGLDMSVWNPETDPHLAATFSAATTDRRGINKAALQEQLGLTVDPDAPLCAVVSRLSWQKGLDLLLDVLPSLMEAGGQLALLGTGDAELERALRAQADRFPGQVGLYLGYDETLAHLFQAAADLLLVPSRFEPCGLTQLAALRYGALPLVTHMGGLADTIIDANEAALNAGVATGFQCMAPTAESLRTGLIRALRLWETRHDASGAWVRTQRNAMACAVGWERPAKHYAALYRELAARHT
jgi:starch synthase